MRQKIYKEAAERMVELYEADGWTTRKLAAEFNLSVQGVCNVLRREGVSLRTRGRVARKSTQDG